MATWRVNNSTALGGEVCSPWQANHAYAEGARCVCTTGYATTTARAVVFECTTAGTSHASTQPTWDITVGNTTSDGTVTWTARSPGDGNWDNASAIMFYVTQHAGITAGDTILVDDGHADNYALSTNIYGTTDKTLPLVILCVDKTDDSLSVGAVCGPPSGSYTLTHRGFGYSYGVTWKCPYHPMTFSSVIPGHWILESDGAHDVVSMTRNNATTVLTIGNNADGEMRLEVINGGIHFLHAAGQITSNYASNFIWKGGTLSCDAANMTALLATGEHAPTYLIEDVDLSAIGTGAIQVVGIDVIFNTVLRRCKLHAETTFLSGTPESCGNISVQHCSSGNRYYDFYEYSMQGVCTDETTIVRTGGSSDGTTGFSCKMVSSANCNESYRALKSIPTHGWTDSTTETTFTIEFVHDSATALQNDEIWMELEYPANNTDGLGAVALSKCAILGTPADTTDSSETWTTTGLTNPNTRKLSVTVTPGKAGPITARVYLAKPSTTVYIDPMITEN